MTPGQPFGQVRQFIAYVIRTHLTTTPLYGPMGATETETDQSGGYALRGLQSGDYLLWALRLGSFLFARILADGGDSRFDRIKPSAVIIGSSRSGSLDPAHP